MNADPLALIRPVEIDPVALARWEVNGRRLSTVTPSVWLEIRDLYSDPCLHRVARAATAARYAASVADEPLKTEALSLAEDLERWASCRRAGLQKTIAAVSEHDDSSIDISNEGPAPTPKDDDDAETF